MSRCELEFGNTQNCSWSDDVKPLARVMETVDLRACWDGSYALGGDQGLALQLSVQGDGG